MVVWLSIAGIIALLSVSALCFYGILVLRDIRSGMKAFSRSTENFTAQLPSDLTEVRARLLATIKNVEDVSRSAALITQKLQSDMSDSDGIFAEIEALTKQLRRLREYLQNGILAPLEQISITITALGKGSSAFIDTLRRRTGSTAREASYSSGSPAGNPQTDVHSSKREEQSGQSTKA